MAFDPAELKRNRQIYEVTATASRIQIDCKAIEDYDKVIEKKMQQATFLTVGGFIGIFGAVFGAAITEVSLIAFILLPVGGTALLAGLILQARFKGLNIPDIRYRLLPEILAILSRDTERNEPFQVKLVCSAATQKDKKTDTQPDPLRRGWKIDFFEDTWLKVSGTFVDGTDFSLTLTDLSIAKYGYKRSRSGKSKFKRKEKPKAIELLLDLQFSRKRYGEIRQIQDDIINAIQLPEDVQLKRLKVSDRSLTLGIKAAPGWGTEAGLKTLITQLFLNAYHVLTLAKQMSKQAR
ncbi:hypothetical protein [Leptolyngbya sp. PCC 6406]|uniref:hypothetical protein n=1 Tax=Leptolyngbya sp. PCC 6406 TaxID=1173264 RepID=UPI0002AC1543|nr:hypothetical protein [Leptolyngbya sp. PCC 6406]